MIHSQVHYHLPVVIPGVRKQNPRRIQSRGPQLLNVRIGYLLQQVLIRQGADGPMGMRERIIQILDDIFLIGQVSRPFLIGMRKHVFAQ